MPDNRLEQYRSALLLLARAQLARHRQLGLEASDLVQQTFLQLHRARRDFDPSQKLKPWIFTIAMNLNVEPAVPRASLSASPSVGMPARTRVW